MPKNWQNGQEERKNKKDIYHTTLYNMKLFKPTLIFTLLCTCSLTAKADEHQFELSKNLDIFHSIFTQLDMFYVDSMDIKRSMLIGIDAILEDLDPYTEYYSEEDMGDLELMTTGKYGGIGSLIRMRKDSTVIIAEPYAGMPAAEVGLQVGDKLLQIDTIDLKGKVTSEVSNLLRGEPGTTFTLKVQRPNENGIREFRIKRRNIKLPALPFYSLVQPEIGYLRLTQFTDGCSKELGNAITELKEKGAKSLILDLRDNGGGLIGEAIDIVNFFVEKNKNIVETKGKIEEAHHTYTTRHAPLDLNIPLVILVDGSTASASEIVSGALQDLKRAVVIGARTYGKGLVQSTRGLPYNGSLKLTTAKYYLPSGRCIQAIDYKQRRNSKTTVAKRDSLGGIMPDISIEHDTLSNMLFYLSNDDIIVDWGIEYMQAHEQLPPVSEFHVTDTDLADLLQMAKEKNFKYDRMSEKRLEELKKMAIFEGYYDDAKAEFDALEKKLEHNLDRDFEINKNSIRKLMEAEIVKRYAYQAGLIEQSLKDDNDLKKAIEVLSTPKEYQKILLR